MSDREKGSVPEVEVPAPLGRTDFSEPPHHDVWGKVEAAAAEDVKVAPVPAEPSPPAAEQPVPDEPPTPAEPPFSAKPSFSAEQPVVPAERPTPADGAIPAKPPAPAEQPAWEGSLFDGDAADPRQEAVIEQGPAGPPKPGKPSSGNWQMPEWMADEDAADAKLGGSADVIEKGGGGSRLVLYAGVGLLVVALLAAGGVYYLKHKDDAEPPPTEGKPAAAGEKEVKVDLPPDKPLKRFPGRPSRMLGRVADTFSGLSYPRLAAPWQVPTKKNRLGTAGWSGQQVLVTERRGGRMWYGQLLTGSLPPALQSSYKGPRSVKTTAVLAAKEMEAGYYGFPHGTAPLASQALTVDGRKGWLVASYLTYRRAGVRATGEVVATAVIDNGRAKPAVVFASLPNTHRRMWSDLNQFFAQLKVAP